MTHVDSASELADRLGSVGYITDEGLATVG